MERRRIADVPYDCSEILSFWFGDGDKLIYNGGLWWRGFEKKLVCFFFFTASGIMRDDVQGNTEEERRTYTDKYIGKP